MVSQIKLNLKRESRRITKIHELVCQKRMATKPKVKRIRVSKKMKSNLKIEKLIPINRSKKFARRMMRANRNQIRKKQLFTSSLKPLLEINFNLQVCKNINQHKDLRINRANQRQLLTLHKRKQCHQKTLKKLILILDFWIRI